MAWTFTLMNPQAMIDRRKFLAGLFIAPAIIASTNLMPVVASHRVVAPSIYTEAQLKQAILEAWRAGGSPDHRTNTKRVTRNERTTIT